MIQIRLFEEEDLESLEEEVNDFLEDFLDHELVSLQYQFSSMQQEEEMVPVYGMCVVYRIKN